MSATKRWLRTIAITLALLFALGNFGLSMAYYNRVLPRTQLGTLNMSGRSQSSLQQVRPGDIASATLTLTHGSIHAEYPLSNLGITVDAASSTRRLRTGWHWLPLFSLFSKYYAPVTVKVEQTTLTTSTEAISKQFRQPALGRHVGLQKTTFVVQPARSGYKLDESAFLPRVLSAVQHGQSTVAVPIITTVAASIDTNKLNSETSKLQKQLDTPIRFAYGGKTIEPTLADRSHWFATSGMTMATSAAAAKPYVAQLGRQLGITIANPDDLATAAAYAAGQNDTRTLNIVPSGGQTIARTYCTAAKGVNASMLASLIEALALTYNDSRGWNNSGKIAFQHVASDCQYTVWLTTAANMTSFGSICDNYYNCQVGTNVILNYDRWTSATPPWNTAGGNIRDYHELMINHETGHRLGFSDNPTCPGSGQPAPVMMQQSIDLKGCTFNIWPRLAEFDRLNQLLNLGKSTSVTDIQ